MSKSPYDAADKGAVILSAMCVAHCLLTPFLLILVPALTTYALFEGETLHIILLFIVLPVSVFSVGISFLRHRDVGTLALAFSGLSMLIFAVSLAHDWFGHEAETGITVLGSLLIAIGHIRNLKLRRSNYSLNAS